MASVFGSNQPFTHSTSSVKRSYIHKNTYFRWRHRFLSWIKQDKTSELHGIIEADETYLYESQKGSHNLDHSPVNVADPPVNQGSLV